MFMYTTQSVTSILFFDAFSGRFFHGHLSLVDEAVAMCNHSLAIAEPVRLNQFYELLGLPPITFGDDLCWGKPQSLDAESYDPIDVRYYGKLTDDGFPTKAFSFSVNPTFGKE